MDPGDSLFFLFKDQPFVSVFSHQEFFADEETSKKGLLAFPFQEVLSSPGYRWFIKKRQERHFEFLIHRERWLITNTIVHYLMDFSDLRLYLRVMSIYQISSYLTEGYWIK